jgi:excisionase family DNA binding protein
MQAENTLLTYHDVMSRTRLSKRKLQMEKSCGALPYVQFGRSVRFLTEDVDQFIRARRNGGRAVVGFG